MLCIYSVGEFVRHGLFFFFFQAEDGIRDLVRSRGLGDVYKRQAVDCFWADINCSCGVSSTTIDVADVIAVAEAWNLCLLYTSDAADERSSVDLGGRRII